MKYELVLGYEKILINEEEKNNTKTAIEQGLEMIEIRDSLIKVSAIQGIISMPMIQELRDEKSGRNHPKHQAYINEVNKFGYIKSFETYLDQINYPRQTENRITNCGGENDSKTNN